MVRTHSFALTSVVLLLELVPLALAHGHDGHDGMSMDMAMSSSHTTDNTTASPPMTSPTEPPLPSYFSHPEYSGLILAHIVLMTIGWLFILPIS